MTYKDEREMHKDLGNILPEVMKEMKTTPEELGIEMDKDKGTMWDINPQSRHKWHNIQILSNCCRCNNIINGYLVLDKKDLKVIDSKNFMLFNEGTMCRRCVDK